MGILEILFGQVPEAIYFSLFIILAKEIKNKRILFTSIMIFEYLALKQFINYDVAFQFIYTFMVFVNLKVLYKEKALITDIFVFMLASLILIVISFISYMITYITIGEYYVAVILNRLLLVAVLIVFKNRLPEFYKSYKFFWNRHKDKPAKIKSLTLRNISVILFNLMFYIINIGLIYFLANLK